MLAAATQLGDARHEAYAHYHLGELAEADGRFAAAGACYDAALAALARAGPPAADAATAAPQWVRDLRPSHVLVSLGLAAKRRGDSAAAERAYMAALEERDAGWPQSADPGGEPTPAMTACANLCVLHFETTRDAAKHAARLRQWRSVLLAAGVGVPSDTLTWLQYEHSRLHGSRQPGEVLELFARARRVLPPPNPRLGTYLRLGAEALQARGDAPAALAALDEALTLARAHKSSAFQARRDATLTLCQIARLHLSMHAPGVVAAPAAKTAALRAFAAAGTQPGDECAEILEAMVQVLHDPVAQGIPDIRVQLPGAGRLVSLHEPDGLGRIALCRGSATHPRRRARRRLGAAAAAPGGAWATAVSPW